MFRVVPSPVHEALRDLFRDRPALAAELLRLASDADIPSHDTVRYSTRSSVLARASRPRRLRAHSNALLVNVDLPLDLDVDLDLNINLNLNPTVIVHAPAPGTARSLAHTRTIG